MAVNLQDTLKSGWQALQAGELKRAFSLFQQAGAAGADDKNALLGLAMAARGAGEHDECMKAAERLLKLEPTNFEALILKADALKAGGNERRAAAFYLTAVKSAPPPARLSVYQSREFERARRACADAAMQYEELLRERVKALGVYDGSGRARGEQALDILLGRKQIYFQQPEKFFFPELPQIQFYEPAQFAWTNEVIAATDDIRAELDAIVKDPSGFEAYVPKESKTPHLQNNEMMGNEDWGACHFFKDGEPVDNNVARCPKTIAALSHAPQPDVAGKCPIALFSRLKPGAHIPPHAGIMNTRLICHLPIIAPQGCVIRVGNQERRWRLGEMLIFDDSIEHEARNTGTQDRVILLFDIWRPELSEDDRAFVRTVFRAIEDFGVF